MSSSEHPAVVWSTFAKTARTGEKWLKSLARERDMFLAVYAEVIRSGQISVGDRVRAV